MSCGHQTSLWLCVRHSSLTPPPPNAGENPLGGACRVVCESPAMEELVNCFSAQSKESAPGGDNQSSQELPQPKATALTLWSVEHLP